VELCRAQPGLYDVLCSDIASDIQYGEAMHPNVFLKTFWRMDLKPQIFVAMSFASRYDDRFKSIIAPAIRAIRINDVPLEAYRVDTSKSGDSILTDIMEGIAHSQMVLADVSTQLLAGMCRRNFLIEMAT
jgi:hypothetical protein